MKKILVSTLALCLPGALFASGPGTTAANFLKMSMSPRAAALAGAYSALADDSGAVFVNPAGLASQEGSQAGLGFATYFQDVKTGELSYTGEAGGRRFGVGVSLLTVSDINRYGTTDNTGAVSPLGTFGANDMAVSFSHASRDVLAGSMDNLDFGVAVKFIRSKIDDESAMAAAVDIGTLYRFTEKTNFSLALQNLGTEMKFVDESDPLPINLRAGMLYRWSESANLLAEVNQYFADEKFYAAFAGEYWLREGFALRGGYRFGYDTSNLGAATGLALGFGISNSGIGLDYAYTPFGELGDIHRFGFSMKF
ncbi:MAG TPA: hypothetical protein DDW67_07030 [Elusimicrobia bacterium]|nr:hypothetical protein [Elusimicrobiota bacterium]